MSLVEIVVIVDRSGSMSVMRDEAIGGFNDFLQDQKDHPGQANFTLVLFDHEYLLVHDGVDVQGVPELNTKTYEPRGTTALLDAMGRTIDDVGERLANTPEENRPEKVIVCIITDGLENASKDYTRDRVTEMVEHQRDKYNWEFLFLAAGLGAVQSSQMVNMQSSTYTVAATGKGMQDAYRYGTQTVSSYRSDAGSTDDDD